MSGRREMIQTTPEARKALEETVFLMYLEGKTRPGSAMWYDCIGDPVVYGNLIVRIKEYLKLKQHAESQEQRPSTDVSGESVSSTESASGQVNQEEPGGIQEDGARKGQTVRQRKGASQKQPRRRVRKEVQVQGDESQEGEGDVSRYGCLRDCFQRTRRLCFFW